MKWTHRADRRPRNRPPICARQMQSVDKIETPDDKTVRLVMKEPTATLPLLVRQLPHADHLAASPIAQDAGRRRTVHAQGAGARRLARTRGVRPNYYKPGLPKLKAIRAIAYADENLRVAALQAGDVDLIEYVPWQSMEAIGKDAEADARRRRRAVHVSHLQRHASRRSTTPACARRWPMPIKRDEIVKAAFFGRGSPPRASADHRERASSSTPSTKHGWRYDPDARQEAAGRGGPSERLHLHAAVDRAIRHAQGHGRGRAAESRRDRHPGGAQPAGLGDPRHLGNGASTTWR